ncbi:MAG: hypothetical protein Kow0099_37730 [Candidatus Abyssubacteria bacterium]
MTELQRSVLAISSLLVLLLGALVLITTGDVAEKAPVVQSKLAFKSSFAYEKAVALATQFPERGMGTEGGVEAAQWIQAQMKKLRLRTEMQPFSAWIAGKRVNGQNVVGTHEGVHDGAIILIAHYDIPYHVREGAMDNASGVGVLLELARAFAREEQKKTLVFVASDGEEWGMLGARHFVDAYPNPREILAVVSLDYVRVENPEKIYVRGEGQFRGYAPLWLWMLTEDCISAVGGTPHSPTPLMRYVTHAVNISSTDQGPFLREGIPGINLGGNKSDSPLARRIYHTPLDISENLKPELFDVYGRAAEQLVRSLDAIDSPMNNDSYYLRTGERHYIGRGGLLALQAMLFVPLFLATSFEYYNLRKREKFLKQVLAELVNIVLFLIPWLAGLLCLYLLVRTNIIPRYELYPATPLDPFLSDVRWSAMAILAAVIAVSWAAIILLRRRASLWVSPDFSASKAVCLDFLLTISVIALLLNGFAASLFLGPAALMWGWLENDARRWRRALNVVFGLAGAAPLLMLALMFSKQLALGVYVIWYLVLGAGYQFFSAPAVLLALGTTTVGVRLLQKSLMPPARKSEPEMETE